MHRALGYLSKRVVQIRRGEQRKVLLTFLYFFLVITAYYVVKPVSRSLVLDDLGHRLVPYADLVCAVLMGPIVTLFARLVDRVSKPRLVSVLFLAVSAVTVLFWELLGWHQAWVSGAFYVWVNIFSVLIVTMFWLVANDLYRPREAKRLFGFIGSGGILGGIAGSSIAAVGAQLVGTPNLLLLSAGLLALCWVIVQALWRYVPTPALNEAETLASRRHDTFLSQPGGFFKLIRSSRYLLLLIALVGLSKIIGTLIYYQLNPFIEQQFPTADAKTTFTGIFFGAVNVLAFVLQFFFTSWILRRWGLLCALLILPAGLLGGSLALAALPLFWIAAGTELYDHTLNYSLHNTAKEVLYLPIDRSIRYKVKPFIDMVVFRFGKGVAAVLGILLLDGVGLSPRWLSVVTIPLLVAWLVVAWKIRGEYTATIRTTLKYRAASATVSASRAVPSRLPVGMAGRQEEGEPSFLDGAAAAELLGPLITSRPPQEKLSLLAKLVTDASLSAHTKALMLGLEQHEALPPDTEAAHEGMTAAQLQAVIQDHAKPRSLRRQAVRLLGNRGTQEAFDYLAGMVVVENDTSLRYEALRMLVMIRTRHHTLQVPSGPLRRQVAREVGEYRRIARVAAVYRHQHPGPVPPDDPILALLRVLMEEAVEQVFRLLVLLYRPEDICLVYGQLRAPDTYVRADAIELLDNLVDPAMRGILLPILDEDRFLSSVDQEPLDAYAPAVAYRVLQDAIWDHHYWLSVTTLCAVGRLRLGALRGELEKASRHSLPFVAIAAQVALRLVALS